MNAQNRPTYDSSEEITVRMKVPYPFPHFKEERRYPGVGIIFAVGFGLLFWSGVIFAIARH